MNLTDFSGNERIVSCITIRQVLLGGIGIGFSNKKKLATSGSANCNCANYNCMKEKLETNSVLDFCNSPLTHSYPGVEEEVVVVDKTDTIKV